MIKADKKTCVNALGLLTLAKNITCTPIWLKGDKLLLGIIKWWGKRHWVNKYNNGHTKVLKAEWQFHIIKLLRFMNMVTTDCDNLIALNYTCRL